MMTNSLAQIAGQRPRHVTQGGDETDLEVLAARTAAELPASFVWGTATSAYQIEGAVAADGRRPCIRDTFAAMPGKTWRGESGDPGCDHHYRDAAVDEPDRSGYIARPIDVVRGAVRDGVDVCGYFAWSLMDNDERAEGDRMRPGIVHVGLATQRRTPKSTARWYSNLVQSHRKTGGPA